MLSWCRSRHRWLTAALLAPLAALPGCGEGDSQPPASVAPPAASVAIGSLPQTLDPARAVSLSERAIAAATQTPLLTYRRSAGPDGGRLVPALARELPSLSDDEREYRFALRPGLLYADGRIVTASDVERAIAHASRVAADAELRDALASIEGAPSRDGETLSGVRSDDVSGNVVVRLRRPDGRVPFALADPATAPQPALPRGAAAAPEASTGPLRVARRTTQLIDLVANPLRPSIREVPASRFQRITLAPGSSDAAGSADLDLFPRDTRPEGITRATATAGPTWLLVLAAAGAFARQEARGAAVQALDRRQLPQRLPWTISRGGRSTPAGLRSLAASCGVLPPHVAGAVDRAPCPPPPGRIDEEDGLPLAGVTVRLGVPQSPAADDLRRLVTASVEAAGGTVRRTSTDDPLAALAGGRIDAALVRLAPGLPHPSGWMTPLSPFDALVQREARRLQRGPLTGTAARWASLDRRLVDRFTAVPLASERRLLDVGAQLAAGSVLLHPVYGLDLAALAPR